MNETWSRLHAHRDGDQHFYHQHHHAGDGIARAFTLVEATISIFIVGVMIVTALSIVGATRLGEYKVAESTRGLPLAQNLMAEILQQAYTDPEHGLGSFGLDAGEVGDGIRTLWEDVDDYDGWPASPPEQKKGTPIEDFAGWRSVDIAWVDPMNLSQVKGAESKTKCIIVTVTHNDVPVASISAFRTSVWPGVTNE